MMKVGDLVIIRNTEIIESFVFRDAFIDETLLGLLIELQAEDHYNHYDDVWIVLVGEQLYKMLRWEFEPCNKSGRVVI